MQTATQRMFILLSLFSILRWSMAERPRALADVIARDPHAESADFRGDTHAGVLETAQLLHLHRAWVDADYGDLPRQTFAQSGASSRPRNPLYRLRAVRELAGDARYFVAHSYSGAPAAASAELGERILEVFARTTAEGLAQVLDGRVDPTHGHTPPWKRFWLLNPLVTRVLEVVLGLRSPIA